MIAFSIVLVERVADALFATSAIVSIASSRRALRAQRVVDKYLQTRLTPVSGPGRYRAARLEADFRSCDLSLLINRFRAFDGSNVEQ